MSSTTTAAAAPGGVGGGRSNNNTNMDNRRRGGGGRGGGGRGSGGRGGRGGGQHAHAASLPSGSVVGSRGPSHFGSQTHRPDRVEPCLLPDDDDDDKYNNGDLVALSTTTTTAQPQPQQYCIICYTSNTKHKSYCIAPCGHDDICWKCHLQMRYLHSDNKCPVCKTMNDTLIVVPWLLLGSVEEDGVTTKDMTTTATANINTTVTTTQMMMQVKKKKFEDFSIWGEDIVGYDNYIHRHEVGMHFPTLLYNREVVPLLGYGCGMPQCEYNDQGDTYITTTTEQQQSRGGVERKQEEEQQQQQMKQLRPTISRRETKKRLMGLPALKSHLRSEHGYTLCELCIDNKRDFISKLCRYTPRGIKEHESNGDPDGTGFHGHPLCEFCKPQRFYDVVKLHEHLNKEHYKCHVCDKQGMPNQFFKDYIALEKHFDREHYLCSDPQCLAARFVVFENDVELRVHEASVHGSMNAGGGTKIKLEFRIRREAGEENILRRGDGGHQVPTGEDFQYGLDGEAFVPEALPDERVRQQRQTNEPEITHPLHAARTAELRAQAARVRARDGTVTGSGGVTEAFPALGINTVSAVATGGNASGMLVGWTSEGVRAVASGPGGVVPAGGRLKMTSVGRVTEDEYPSLAPPPPASKFKLAKSTGNIVGLKKPTTRGSIATGPKKFSAVASSPVIIGRPTLDHGLTSFVPSTLTPLSSSTRTTVPNLTSTDNFPSLGASRSTATINETPYNQQSSNPYAAVQAHTKKLKQLQQPSFGLSDFPPSPSSSAIATKKSTTISTAFAPKKPPPSDNILQFPPLAGSNNTSHPPPCATESIEAGKMTIESLKQLLGTVQYKKLRKATKEFASGTMTPEQYVDLAASFFDHGFRDEAFWDNIPSLIRDIPNAAAVNGAMWYLDETRVVNNMLELEFGDSGGGETSAGKKPTIKFVLPKKKTTSSSWGK